ncbi:MAG: hypothetical protein O3C10_13755 [Chloroflexi bacterium]|nr:hypothetical protein [Chloroflexota bacterium]
MNTQIKSVRKQGGQSGIVAAVVILLAAIVSVASYASTESSSTLNILALGTSSGGVADVVDVGIDFKATNKKGKKTEGIVISRFEMGQASDSDNFIADVVWTNSKDVKGILKSHDAFLFTGLYFMDSDQQKASNGGYSGDCGDQSQRETKDVDPEEMGEPAGPDQKFYLCPDTSPNSSKVMSSILPNAVLTSTTPDKANMFLLADIHKPPKKSDHEIPAGSNPGQVKKLEFNITLKAI